DNLKNHVDPRTYDYVRRVFALMKIPEEKFSRYRPWLLILMLDYPSGKGFSDDLGVDEFLAKRAAVNSKPAVGLESWGEHASVFSGLTDRQSEALLLLSFIPQANGSGEVARTMSAWRQGDVDTLARSTRDSFRDFPFFGERLLGARNRNWLPKVECDWLDISELGLPLCDADACYTQPAAQGLNKAIEAADGILVATPVYNYDVSAAAKNMVELTGSSWEEKVVGFLCAAGGMSS